MENVNLLCSTFTKKAGAKKHTGYRLPSVPQFFCLYTSFKTFSSKIQLMP